VGALIIIWSLWLCINDKVFNDNFFSYAGNLSVHIFAPFMVISTMHGESTPVYRGIYTVGYHNKGYFYTTWLATSIDVITISFDCIAHFIALAWTFADVYILAMQRPGVMLLKNQLIKHSS
jgi:hypothetical protein